MPDALNAGRIPTVNLDEFLVQPLRADPSRYVQNSVANWLNDAAKTQPQRVREVCAQWSRGSVPRETAYIVRRAQRSIA